MKNEEEFNVYRASWNFDFFESKNTIDDYIVCKPDPYKYSQKTIDQCKMFGLTKEESISKLKNNKDNLRFEIKCLFDDNCLMFAHEHYINNVEKLFNIVSDYLQDEEIKILFKSFKEFHKNLNKKSHA